MKLNCDLGESFGFWRMGMDDEVMPYIDEANIACGFHAGDPVWMRRTLLLAQQHGVTVGAHPGYPDKMGFGRRSMRCSDEEVLALLHYQMAALDGMARSLGMSMSYVKPHGALYNDMMRDASLRRTIMHAVAEYSQPINLVLQATPDWQQHGQEAKEVGIELAFEVFADRGYDDSGLLLSRGTEGALLSDQQALAQVRQLQESGSLFSQNGRYLELPADTLCVHGDNPQAVALVKSIRQLLTSEGAST